ncbi:MAG: hypothetical protein H6534_06495 [Chthonomonadaceae bacterium]|nr:hypothetical protein [Chthonomonadaceae bacterium]
MKSFLCAASLLMGWVSGYATIVSHGTGNYESRALELIRDARGKIQKCANKITRHNVLFALRSAADRGVAIQLWVTNPTGPVLALSSHEQVDLAERTFNAPVSAGFRGAYWSGIVVDGIAMLLGSSKDIGNQKMSYALVQSAERGLRFFPDGRGVLQDRALQ